LAAALVDLGEHEQALTLIVNAIEQQQRAGKFLHMPALFGMKGLILASRSVEDQLEAEESLLSAIDWAKRQSATLFELKAATDLGELLLKQDRLPEACQHLSSAFDRTPAELYLPITRAPCKFSIGSNQAPRPPAKVDTFDDRALSAQADPNPRIPIQASGLQLDACCGGNGHSGV
jgi:hypothetical protein